MIRSPPTPSASRLVASSDTPRTVPGDPVEQERRIVEDVFAVVHDQQQFARPQVVDDGLLDAETLLLL